MLLYFIQNIPAHSILYYAWDYNGYNVHQLVGNRHEINEFAQYLRNKHVVIGTDNTEVIMEHKQFNSLGELKGYCIAMNE